MIIVNVLISTNASTLEKETLYLPKEAIDEFLGEGFASNCYDAKVSFKCMPRFVNPDLINVLIELKDFIENFVEFGVLVKALIKFLKRTKGYKSVIQITYKKDGEEFHYTMKLEEKDNVEERLNKIKEIIK